MSLDINGDYERTTRDLIQFNPSIHPFSEHLIHTFSECVLTLLIRLNWSLGSANLIQFNSI